MGLDLRIRSRSAALFYGDTRPMMERLVASSTSLARAGMAYFAGERVPRSQLAVAALHFAREGVRQLVT